MTAQGYIDPDYVDVAERIRVFYQTYPDGRLCTLEHGLHEAADRLFVWVRAEAYRNPDDEHPAVGTAWEPIPGPTPFTRDSELMNAETAAWGRAIVAVGIPSKKIASADEVKARRAPAEETTGKRDGAPAVPPSSEPISNKRHGEIALKIKALEDAGYPPPEPHADWTAASRALALNKFGKKSRKDLTEGEGVELVKLLQAQLDDVPFG